MDKRRHLPSVSNLLKEQRIIELCYAFSRPYVVQKIRAVIQRVREGEEGIPQDWAKRVKEELSRRQHCFSPLINATGILLHTHLGRAPLGEFVLSHVVQVSKHYCNLEFDLERGMRGGRNVLVEQMLVELTGAEGAVVVNNNAASLVLTMAALAQGKKVLISRGELVEIGGSFRVQELVLWSGVRLAEVGSTNRTCLKDFEQALDSEVGAILKVSRSNFAQIGFVEEASIQELAFLCRQKKIPLIYDKGGGAILSFAEHFEGRSLIPDIPFFEDGVISSIKEGADLVLFSGDKLLGGPQAGIVLGKKQYSNNLLEHPLYRAFRPDKMTLAALEATLSLYLCMPTERLMEEIPLFKMLRTSESILWRRGGTMVSSLQRFLKESALDHLWAMHRERTVAELGGGSNPLYRIPSVSLVVRSFREGGLNKLNEKLRQMDPPVIGRIANGVLFLDLRTVFLNQLSALLQALKLALKELYDS